MILFLPAKLRNLRAFRSSGGGRSGSLHAPSLATPARRKYLVHLVLFYACELENLRRRTRFKGR